MTRDTKVLPYGRPEDHGGATLQWLAYAFGFVADLLFVAIIVLWMGLPEHVLGGAANRLRQAAPLPAMLAAIGLVLASLAWHRRRRVGDDTSNTLVAVLLNALALALSILFWISN